MLSSQLGIRLILWLGQTIPAPAPYEITSALASAEVINDADGNDGFRLTLTLGNDRAADFSLLRGGLLDPFTRVVIGVLLTSVPEILIDGVITHQQVVPSNEPGRSTLTVIGKDLSQLLDLDERNDEYRNLSDSAIVAHRLLDYAALGLVPQVTATADTPTELQRITRQHESNLKFIQRLAKRNGFVFYVEPISFRSNTVYFGPEKRGGLAQPALTLNMGGATNVNTLSFALDALVPVDTNAVVLEPITKMPIPIPPLPSLRVPPLSLRPVAAKRSALQRNTANQDAAQAATTLIAAATNATDAVRGDGALDTVRYGGVLRARRMVGVRGAGLSYNGDYYVRRVTHNIARGAYTQSFSLSRDGLDALLPVVRL